MVSIWNIQEFRTWNPSFVAMCKDIEKKLKWCKKCSPVAKAPLITFSKWPATDKPWTGLHVDFAGPLNGFYSLIVVDSFTKSDKASETDINCYN